MSERSGPRSSPTSRLFSTSMSSGMEAAARPTARSAALCRSDRAGKRHPACQSLNAHIPQVGVPGQKCAQRTDIESYPQTVLDRHPLQKRRGRQAHRPIGGVDGRDLAAQGHAPRNPLHLHPVQPRLASHERAKRPEVQPNLKVVLHQHPFRDGGNGKADRPIGSLCRSDRAGKRHATRQRRTCTL